MSVDYRLEPDLSPAEFIDVLVRSTLAGRRPVDRPDVIAAMLTNADIVLTARVEGQLVGIARSVSDFPIARTYRTSRSTRSISAAASDAS